MREERETRETEGQIKRRQRQRELMIQKSKPMIKRSEFKPIMMMMRKGGRKQKPLQRI